MKLMVTGGAGFVGSALIRAVIASRPEDTVLNFDKLTYAGNLDNVASVAASPNYRFIQGDITNAAAVEKAFRGFAPDAVVHLAAESHVDRSVVSSVPTFETNLRGTVTLLEAVRRHETPRFVHVSTGEVYGTLDPSDEAHENYPLRPGSPYSSSKAGSDLLALSYFRSYGMNVNITRASNNYGPFQFPEQFIPFMISNALENKTLPLYGDGLQTKDWLYVDDHCRAILAVLENGRAGEVYNVGGTGPLTNLAVAKMILQATGRPEGLLRSMGDGAGPEKRYALNSEKLKRETGWRPRVSFEEGLERTIAWYQANHNWLARLKSGEYMQFLSASYPARLPELTSKSAH